MALGKVKSQNELRDIVRQSFPLTTYEPHRTGNWDEHYARFLRIKG
jgi:rhamnulokinase